MSEMRKEIGELWRRANRDVHDRLRAAFQDSDLHFGMLMMLRQINKEPGVTVSELARRSGVAKSHVSKMIEHLARLGYLEKRPDASDQRLLHSYLTSAGAERVAQAEGVVAAAWGEVTAQIPEGELEDVARGLRILAAALERSKQSEGKGRS